MLRLIFGLLICFTLGVICPLLVLKSTLNSHRISKTYIETQATVLQAQTKREGSHSKGHGLGCNKYARITHTYTVKQQRYTNTDKYKLCTKERKQLFSTKHQKGNQITIYYDPNKHSDSVIFKGFEGIGPFFFAIVACVIAGLGGAKQVIGNYRRQFI